MEEIWKSVPGYEGFYEVSNCGKVRSLPRTVHNKDGIPVGRNAGKILSLSVGLRGRRQVMLYKNRKYQCFKVHALVMLAFVGPRPDGMDICHNDGNASNNVISNLRYDTRSGNFSDKIKHGTHHRGDNAPFHKITDAQVQEIRKLRNEGRKCKELGKIFGVHEVYISQICRGVVRKFS